MTKEEIMYKIEGYAMQHASTYPNSQWACAKSSYMAGAQDQMEDNEDDACCFAEWINENGWYKNTEVEGIWSRVSVDQTHVEGVNIKYLYQTYLQSKNK